MQRINANFIAEEVPSKVATSDTPLTQPVGDEVPEQLAISYTPQSNIGAKQPMYVS